MKWWRFVIFGTLIALLGFAWYHEKLPVVAAFSFLIGCGVGAEAQYNLLVDFRGKDSTGRKKT